MKPFLLFVTAFLLLISPFSYSQEFHVDSTRYITGLKCCTSAIYSIATSDKGLLIVGAANNYPGGIIPYFFDTSGSNVMVIKIDSNRQISWIKVFGGSNLDIGMSACETADGGYGILATTGSSNGDVTGFKGGQDIWLFRLDAAGNFLWGKTFCETALAISTDNTADHGFIILGVNSNIDTDATTHYGSPLRDDWVVIRTDSLGNKQWCRDLGTTGDEQPLGRILSVDSCFYLISSTDSANNDVTNGAWHTGVYTLGDYHVLKLDSHGAVLWDSSYGGSDNDIPNYAMFDTRDSTIVIIGTTQSNDYMVTDHKGGRDMWVVKIRKDGGLVWTKDVGTANDDDGTSVCSGTNGGYIGYGGTIGLLNDVWIVGLDKYGNELAQKIVGGSSVDWPYSVAISKRGYAAIGESASKFFTEGSNYGNFDTSAAYPDGGGAFISYLDYWPESVSNLMNDVTSIILYPNPCVDKAVVIVNNENSKGTLQVINYLGQTISVEAKTSTQEISLITKDWQKGIYLVMWRSENGQVATSKLIVE